MEEILASIRRIISDDDAQADDEGETVPDAEAGEASVEQTEPEREPEPEEASTNDQSAIDDIFELTEVVEEEAEDESEDPEDEEEEPTAEADEIDFDSIDPDVAEAAADLDFVDAETTAAPPEPDPEPAAPFEKPSGPALLSPDAQATASAAFGALASTMLSHSGGARTLEQIVEDLLRPLLKAWLDDNLPPMVERLVREEIERVARRR